MNKYIITNEQLHTEKGEQEFVISALYNEKRQMIEVDLSPEEETSILGDIYIGRVENVVKNLNAAFIKIGPDLTCYYSSLKASIISSFISFNISVFITPVAIQLT